jgi:adenosylcobinamide kinase / adenosylcobinamide-phosphate guanylyltransferase
MQTLKLITGGQKSGKSKFAAQQALATDPNPIYLATARHWDDEFSERIARHQAERNDQWQCIELETQIHQHKHPHKLIVLDCLTLWLTNIYTDCNYDPIASEERAQQIWQKFWDSTQQAIVVANEIACGLHAETEMGRRFVDLHGSFVQKIAAQANEVYWMVAGIPVQIR